MKVFFGCMFCGEDSVIRYDVQIKKDIVSVLTCSKHNHFGRLFIQFMRDNRTLLSREFIQSMPVHFIMNGCLCSIEVIEERSI
jgi:hypothetical protein